MKGKGGSKMKEWRSQAHVRWECKLPHCDCYQNTDKKRYFEGGVDRLANSSGIMPAKGTGAGGRACHARPCHMLLSVPPKYSIAFTIGYLKVKVPY